MFNAAIRRRTAFASTEMTRALLNNTDTALVAACSTNWYVATNGGVPTLTCGEAECTTVQDLEFAEGEDRCLQPSAMPSAVPSGAPTTEAPTLSSTATSGAPTGTPTIATPSPSAAASPAPSVNYDC